MKRRTYLAAICLLLSTPHPGEAQGILGRVKNRVRERVEGAVDRTVDRAAGCVLGDEACGRRAPASPARGDTASPRPAPREASPPATAATPAATPAARPGRDAQPRVDSSAAARPDSAAPVAPGTPPAFPPRPRGDRTGTVSFTYAGRPGQATIRASGAMSASGANREWAEATLMGGPNLVGLRAAKPRGDGGYDEIAMTVVSPGAGQAQRVDQGCAPECAQMTLFLNTRSEAETEWTCTFKVGSIQIASVEAERIRGTFWGTGDCASSSGVVAEKGVVVRDGVFDLWYPPSAQRRD